MVTTATPSVFFFLSGAGFGSPPGRMRFAGALETREFFCVFYF